MARNIVYILPLNTEILSGEWGWEFVSRNSISEIVLNKILATFEIKLTSKYLDVEKYTNLTIDMNVVFEGRQIKEICIRTRVPISEIMSKLNLFIMDFDVEIFQPPRLKLNNE